MKQELKVDRDYVGEGIYRENILDHYKNVRNLGKIENADLEFHDLNPICGDEMTVSLNFDQDKVREVKVLPKGCAISTASASILSEELKGKNKKEIMKMKTEDIFKLLGIKLNSMRIKCALLPLSTVKKAICGVKNE
ncbi:SUF system NifU family Fe-S cluster assembly protein [archaeon]|nr:SUF system NifU family Fe-S cluster assembly protein [archaeon]|tara:strand:- start:6945 stop:7355 length:411 start_codon:yes stop_codon:yes gene_type:complete